MKKRLEALYGKARETVQALKQEEIRILQAQLEGFDIKVGLASNVKKQESRALGTHFKLERVAIDNFRKTDADMQLRTLEHAARNRQNSMLALDGMMEAFVTHNWKRR